jgi:hypothetical protein
MRRLRTSGNRQTMEFIDQPDFGHRKMEQAFLEALEQTCDLLNEVKADHYSMRHHLKSALC